MLQQEVLARLAEVEEGRDVEASVPQVRALRNSARIVFSDIGTTLGSCTVCGIVQILRVHRRNHGPGQLLLIPAP